MLTIGEYTLFFDSQQYLTGIRFRGEPIPKDLAPFIYKYQYETLTEVTLKELLYQMISSRIFQLQSLKEVMG